MNKIIYKYELMLTGLQVIRVPKGAEILKVYNQKGSIVVWLLVDKYEKETEDISFHLYGTGHAIRENMQELDFVDTVFKDGFVWHIFIEKVRR